jgi:F-type H+-transporting ATPase subunit b
MKKIFQYFVLVTATLWFGGVATYGVTEHAEGPAAVAVEQHAAVAQAAVEQAGDVHEAAAEGHGEAAQPSLLTPELGSAVWTFVLFILLLVILGKFVWPSILKGLQEREGKIRSDLERAEHAAAEASSTLQQYKQQLAEAQKEAQRVIEQSRLDAQKVATQVKDQAQVDIKQMRDRATADIRSAKEQSIAEIYEQTAAIATGIAGKILTREISPAEHSELVRQSLKQMAEAAGN